MAGALQERAVAALADTALGRSDLLNPLDGKPHARFLAFRSPKAAAWQKQLLDAGCVTDVRGDVIRIGFGLYQDGSDVDRLATLAAELD